MQPDLSVVEAEEPVVAGNGRKLSVYWADENQWFEGTLRAIELGHDDGGDNGDFFVLYDDKDEHWEPLG